MDRRDFIKGSMGLLLSVSLLETFVTKDLIAHKARPIIQHWALELTEICRDLDTDAISPILWQEKIECLYNRVELEELMSFIDFDKLAKGFDYPDLGVGTKPVKFPKIEGLPEDLPFYKKIFGMKKDRAIIPHGHKNMVSCHYVLKGDMTLKNYDKVEEDETHMIIKPTVDKIVHPGSSSSISDDKNNIHWFKAVSETAFTFDVIITNIDPDFGKSYDINNIDPYEAEKISGNLLRVNKLDVETALKKYGKEVSHH